MFDCLLSIKNDRGRGKSTCFLYKRDHEKEQAGRDPMKTNTVFKRTYNRSLLRLGEFPVGSDIGSEPAWANVLAVSRTTVRAVLQRFVAVGLVGLEDRRKALKRQPTPDDFFPEAETEQVGAIVEKHFMRWLLDGDC